jgi:hypothetical protein
MAVGDIRLEEEVVVEAVMLSRVRDEAAVCSGARIERNRWRQWHDGF